MSAPATARLQGRRIEVRGVVQGVGFRPFVYGVARSEGVTGWVRNDTRGVTIAAFGPGAALDRLCARLVAESPTGARIEGLSWDPLSPGDDSLAADFVIARSEAPSLEAGKRDQRPRRLCLPPDRATCPECLAEVLDPGDRRYLYPFTNCTHCGPRFTIARAVPYDRPATTMSDFKMCRDCEREYRSPEDRRFHAQPNACPTCGPRLELLDERGRGIPASESDPLSAAARGLRSGQILAIKGLGGFDLACDATSASAVARLRERKRRSHKPFAVMVRDLEAARAIAQLTQDEERLLAGPERPIVLAKRRAGARLAPAVAPGLDLVGLLLPYTPLHHLLIETAGLPLVMTSGNLSEEPLVHSNDQARTRLRGLADAYLVHDREIASRCDDSVVRVIGGAPVLLRRARGFVPEPLRLLQPCLRPVLACGGALKNTFCLAVEDQAYLGPHIGDLGSLETYDAFGETVAAFERFLDVVPEVLAHDLHPDYLSTRYALKRPAELRLGVQHHHAHLASALADHALAGPVLGVVFDGTGYGTDGTAWGGEVLWGEAGGFERIATFRPLPLLGNEQAIREVWRLALALLDDAFEGAPPLARLELFRRLPAERIAQVRSLAHVRLAAPLARGVGRYFDAFGALALAQPAADYEGEVALRFGELAGEIAGAIAATGNPPSDRSSTAYPFVLHFDREPWEIDLRPSARAATGDLLRGAGARMLSLRFHSTLVEATALAVREHARRLGEAPDVVLAGGCFANPLLGPALRASLLPEHRVFLPARVPPGDGGLALGQAVVAAAALARVAASTNTATPNTPLPETRRPPCV